jgi:hypothetical protein
MYEPGTLYYFKPFYFTAGTSKAKYFLTLYTDDKTVVVATLPSSVDHVPSHLEKKHGCLNDLPSDFNAYYCSPISLLQQIIGLFLLTLIYMVFG